MQTRSAILKLFLACTIFMVLGIPITWAAPEVFGSAESTVKMLYSDYAWEALGEEFEKTALEQQTIQELEKYFDNSLAKLIKEDRDCIKKTQDICRLDFKIIFDSQDPAAYEMKISPINKTNDIRVHFKYPSNHEEINLIYKMTNTPKGWRIHDIVYESTHTSLRTLLEK